MRISRIAPSLLFVLIAVAAVVAQTPPATTTTTTAATTQTTATTTGGGVQQTLQEILEEPATADTYRYDPQGRRDPFQSLIGPRLTPEAGKRPPGAAGFLIDEIKLQGVLKTKAGLVGLFNGPDNKGFLLHVGDKVFDGEVVRMTGSSVVFRQEVNDPTRIERYREVVKEISAETAKK